MKRNTKTADKLYYDYLGSFGETVPNPNGCKPLKLTKKRFASLYGFDTWRDFKELIESSEPDEIAEQLATCGSDIKSHTTPLIIESLLSEKQNVEQVLSLHVKLGNLSNDEVERYIVIDNETSTEGGFAVLSDLFTVHDPALFFNLILKDAQFIECHLWERTSFKTWLTVFQILRSEGKIFPEEKLSCLWEEANILLNDRDDTPHWGNFAHANKAAIRCLTGIAVQNFLALKVNKLR